jgi:hypothetical protein
MSVQDLTKAYRELPEADRILFAALIAADQLAHRPDFAADLNRRHEAMDEGKKWNHSDILKLHTELEKEGL